MREYVSTVPWNSLLNDKLNIDDMWKLINDVILEATNKFVPRVNINNNNDKRNRTTKTIPRTMLEKIHFKRRAHKMYRKFPTKENANRYARARNQVKWESRKLIKSNEASLALEAKTNPKRFFQYVASKTKTRESVSNLKKTDDSLTENDKEKADVLNEYFSSVFTKDSQENVPDFEYESSSSNIEYVNVSRDQMLKALQKLNINKSPGPDKVNPRILKELANELAHPLSILFNKSMSEGKLPSQWKVAEVKPIFKKGDKSEAGNYRPVSLTSVVCKIFEGFVRDTICKHLNDNNFLTEHQFGFSKGRSCVTQLLVTINEWMSFLDDNIPVDAIYLDLRKAFDTVPHKHLINKLKGYGIKGKLLDWINDFLQERTQFVNVNGNVSVRSNVTSGVPQGSVLGPILFIYYINDMPSVAPCPMKIFADDTKVFSAIKTEEDSKELQLSIDKLVEWSTTWLLHFNNKKCKVIHLGKNNPSSNYYMSVDNQSLLLESSKAERDLGVLVDPLLDFDKHINETINKANRLAGLLIRTITNKSPDIMIPLFKSLIRPLLEYGNAVWSPYLRKHIDSIETVQRRFTKRIDNASNLDYQDRLCKFKLPSLEYRRLRGDLIEVYKILHGIYDPVTTKKLLTVNNLDKTRGHSYKLTKKRTNSRQFQCFFTNRVISMWNELPSEAVNAESLNIFKNRIDVTFNHYMYSINLE